MERITRSVALARIREREPGFSDKQLKVVIAQFPEAAQRAASGRGSAYTYPAELVDAAIAYAEAARATSRLRSIDLRRIIVWLSRRAVSGSENHAMIDPAIDEFDRVLTTIRIFDEDARVCEESARELVTAASRAPMMNDFSQMVVEFIQSGQTLVAPPALKTYLRRDTISLVGAEPRKRQFDKEEMQEQVAVKFPGAFTDLRETTSHLTDEQLEAVRPVVLKMYEFLTFLLDDRFDGVAQYSVLSEAFQTSALFKSLDAPTRLSAFTLLAVVRPFVSKYFDDVVRALPLCVALLAVIRTQFAIEDRIRVFLAIDVPSLR